jgi:uncharacterized protein YkwD
MRLAILALVVMAWRGAVSAGEPPAPSPPPVNPARALVDPHLRAIESSIDAKSLSESTAGLGSSQGAMDDAGRDLVRREVRAAVLAARDRLAARIRRCVEADLRVQLPRLKAELAKRRETALGHIQDEVAYPEGEKGKEIQPRVDAKVSAVREIWETPLLATGRMAPAVPADLAALNAAAAAAIARAGIETLAKDEIPLEALLADDAGAFARLVQATPADAFDQALLEHNRRTAALNAQAAGLPPAVAEQIAITNAYREMLGRRVLQIDARLVQAAQGHSDAMAKQKKVFHQGTDGTPETRIRRAGYVPLAIGENVCGVVDTAAEAHAQWCRSPGHHRSLVDALFSQIGVGHADGYWTQNFGRPMAPPAGGGR